MSLNEASFWDSPTLALIETRVTCARDSHPQTTVQHWGRILICRKIVPIPSFPVREVRVGSILKISETAGPAPAQPGTPINWNTSRATTQLSRKRPAPLTKRILGWTTTVLLLF